MIFTPLSEVKGQNKENILQITEGASESLVPM